MTDIIEDDDTPMIVQMEAGDIPDQSIVTKATGTYKHRLFNKIFINKEQSSKGFNDKSCQTIYNDGCKMIISIEPGSNPSITIIPNSKILLWHTTSEKLRNWMDKKEMGEPC
jgi:hypothetical protein